MRFLGVQVRVAQQVLRKSPFATTRRTKHCPICAPIWVPLGMRWWRRRRCQWLCRCVHGWWWHAFLKNNPVLQAVQNLTNVCCTLYWCAVQERTPLTPPRNPPSPSLPCDRVRARHPACHRSSVIVHACPYLLHVVYELFAAYTHVRYAVFDTNDGALQRGAANGYATTNTI